MNKYDKNNTKLESKLPIERFLEERNEKLRKKKEYEEKIKLKAWEYIRLYSEYTGETDLNKVKLNFKTNEEILVEFNKNNENEELLWDDIESLDKYINVLLNTEIQRNKDLEKINKVKDSFVEGDLANVKKKFTKFSTLLQFLKTLISTIPRICLISSIMILLIPHINPRLNGSVDTEWLMFSRMLYATIYTYIFTFVFIKIFQPASYIRDIFNSIINELIKDRDLKISNILYYENTIKFPSAGNSISLNNIISIIFRDIKSILPYKREKGFTKESLYPYLAIQGEGKYKITDMDEEINKMFSKNDYKCGHRKNKVALLIIYLSIIVLCVLLYKERDLHLFTIILGISTILYMIIYSLFDVSDNRALSMIYYKSISEDFTK